MNDLDSIAVIISHYPESPDANVMETVGSLYKQTRQPDEIIIVVDEDRDKYEYLRNHIEDGEQVSTYFKEEDEGLAASRNFGVDKAESGIVAFIDDDAIAHEMWVQGLMDGYQIGIEPNDTKGVIGVGGPAYPIWPDSRPWLIPKEFDWLVGAGPYYDSAKKVRNTYGCNFSVVKAAFEYVGGFDERFGKQNVMLQGEEAELADRIRREFEGDFWYRPQASIDHKVNSDQINAKELLRRAYWQGVSKRYIEQVTEFNSETESEYLKELFTISIPERLKQAMKGNVKAGAQIVPLLSYTASVGTGYIKGPDTEVMDDG